jgi:hypothetical protein
MRVSGTDWSHSSNAGMAFAILLHPVEVFGEDSACQHRRATLASTIA